MLFECLIKADPVPSVKWSHNAEAVEDSGAGGRHKLTVQKDGQEYFSALEIKNVTVEDAGKYKVTAKNELGESNATITLNFDSKYIMQPYNILFTNKNNSKIKITHTRLQLITTAFNPTTA